MPATLISIWWSAAKVWVNVGKSQFHLPTGKAQVLRGHTALVIPGRDALLARLASVAPKLEGTAFSFAARNDHVEATCPWGNRLRIHEPDGARFGPVTLGMPHVEFETGIGTARGICAFYKEIMGIPADLADGDEAVARVKVGNAQYLQFRESDRQPPAFDGHHIQIYIADFSGPYRKLLERGLITREDNPYQYRFCDIVDPADGRHLFTVERHRQNGKHRARNFDGHSLHLRRRETIYRGNCFQPAGVQRHRHACARSHRAVPAERYAGMSGARGPDGSR